MTAAVALWGLLRAGGSATRGLDADYRRFAALVDAFGGPQAVLERWPAMESELSRDLFPTDDIESLLGDAVQTARAWTTPARGVLVLGDESYPSALAEIADAPPFLFIDGTVECLSMPAVAIVGARKASDDGRRRARRAAHVMVEAGLTVVSGLAVGIDAAAHAATLEAGGRTVAVMGTPIDRRYPAENSPLADRIVGTGGALVSEFPPGTATQPWHFVRRNRTMSGLVLATLVVEASETSGARSQAHAALEQGRLVFLPSSLVDRHDWARALVESGRRGLHAIEVERPEEVVEMLAGTAELAEPTEFY